MPDQSPAPTARDIFDAMKALRTRKITADEFRAVMARSRAMNGETEHDRLKFVASANFAR